MTTKTALSAAISDMNCHWHARSMMDRFAHGLFLAVFGAGALLAAWLLFQNASKTMIVNRLTEAVRYNDATVLNRMIDWPVVRAQLLVDLSEKAEKNAGATTDSLVSTHDRLGLFVSRYMQPENLYTAFSYFKTLSRDADPAVFVRNVEFIGWTRMDVIIAPPHQINSPWMNRLEPLRLEYRFNGLGWKMVRMDVPTYLLPGTVS